MAMAERNGTVTCYTRYNRGLLAKTQRQTTSSPKLADQLGLNVQSGECGRGRSTAVAGVPEHIARPTLPPISPITFPRVPKVVGLVDLLLSL